MVGLPGSTTEIPDIFDVLEGGEDESTVRFLLGFNGEEASVSLLGGVETFVGMEHVEKYVGDGINLNMTLPSHSPNQEYLQPPVTSTEHAQSVSRSPVIIRQAQTTGSKKRDTSGTKAIHNCSSCGKSFTTKFNLKRHINMHCHKSRENGVPIQGPPSASAPAKKTEQRLGVGKQYVPVSYQVTSPGLERRGEVGSSLHTSRVILSPLDTPLQEPDTTCRLPSVQTLLPVSTVYTMTRPCTEAAPAPAAPSHNTDYGTLPADLFEPDSSDRSSQSGARPGPSSPLIMLTSVPLGWTRKIELGTVLCQIESIKYTFLFLNFIFGNFLKLKIQIFTLYW